MSPTGTICLNGPICFPAYHLFHLQDKHHRNGLTRPRSVYLHQGLQAQPAAISFAVPAWSRSMSPSQNVLRSVNAARSSCVEKHSTF